MGKAASHPSVGFIGLGNMGGPIAARLADAEFSVHGYDTSAEAVERLVEAGGCAARSAADAAHDRDVVGICVVDDMQLEDVLFGAAGALTTSRLPRCVLIHSTIHPTRCVALAARVLEVGVAVLDAPVSAGTFGARDTGNLTVYLGGDPAAVDGAGPVLETIASRIVPTGPIGSGQLAKLANNIVCQMSCVAVGEALKLGITAGLRSADILAAINAGSGRCWFAEGWPAAWMESDGGSARDAPPELIAVGDVPGRVSGAGRNGLKDLTMACDLASQYGLELPFIRAIQSTLDRELRVRAGAADEGVRRMG